MSNINCLVQSPINDKIVGTLLNKKNVSKLDYIRYEAIDSLIDKNQFAIRNGFDYDDGLDNISSLTKKELDAYKDIVSQWNNAIEYSKKNDSDIEMMISTNNQKFTVEYGTYKKEAYYTGKDPNAVRASLKVQVAKDIIDGKVDFYSNMHKLNKDVHLQSSESAIMQDTSPNEKLSNLLLNKMWQAGVRVEVLDNNTKLNNKAKSFGLHNVNLQTNDKNKQIVTSAPYFRNDLTTNNKEQLEQETVTVKKEAKRIADLIGLKIDNIITTGGTYLGSSEISYQYIINSNEQDKIDLFASLMADLGFQFQDASIAANDVTKEEWEKQTDDKAIDLVYSVPNGTTIEEIEKLLNEKEIPGSTFYFNDNELHIIAFSYKEAKKYSNNLKDTDYEQKETKLQNSRYLAFDRRRNVYRTWLSKNSGTNREKLYNACTKALAICEAAAEFPILEQREGQSNEDFKREQGEQDQRRINAVKDAIAKWNEEHPNDKINTSRYTEEDTNKQQQENPKLYKNSNGDILGFAYKGSIYLSKESLNPNTLVHEYTHLWCDAVRRLNPELWENIRTLLKNDKIAIAIEKAIRDDKAYQNLSSDDMIAEVISQLSGEKGRKRLEEIQKELKGEKGLFEKLVDALKQLWEWVGKNLLDIKSFKSIDEITDRVLYDLATGTDVLQLAPMPYNNEQREAINKARLWLLEGNPNESFVIEGKAGTGKTTVAKEIIYRAKLDNPHAHIIIGALSHKATKVIEKSFEPLKNAVTASTLASMLGMGYDDNSGKFYVQDKKDDEPPLISMADIILIDEASMINREAYRLIMEMKRHDAKVIFLGDIGQLPPIESDTRYKDQNSVVFGSKNKASLVTRVRQGEESPILPYADTFWNNSTSETPTMQPFQSPVSDIVTGKGILLAAKNYRNVANNIVKAFKKAIEEKNFNYIKVVTYTNKKREFINKQIHDTLLGDKENKQTGYSDGDFIIFNDTCTIKMWGEKYIIPNSFEFVLEKQNEVHTYDYDGEKIRIFTTPIKLQVGKSEITLNPSIPVREDKEKVNNLIEKYRKLAIAERDRTKKSAYWKKYFELKGFAKVDFGYAITSHKSQGSTYDISVVDVNDITSVSPTTAKSKSQSTYTGITRARKVAVVLSETATENTNKSIVSAEESVTNDAITIEDLNSGKTKKQKTEPKKIETITPDNNTYSEPITNELPPDDLFGPTDADWAAMEGEVEVGESLTFGNTGQENNNANNTQNEVVVGQELTLGGSTNQPANTQQAATTTSQQKQKNPLAPKGEIPTQNTYEANAEKIQENNARNNDWNTVSKEWLKYSTNRFVLYFQGLKEEKEAAIDKLLHEKASAMTGGVYETLDNTGKYYRFIYDQKRKNKELIKRIKKEQKQKNPDQSAIRELYDKIIPTSFEEYIEHVGPEYFIQEVKDNDLTIARQVFKDPNMTWDQLYEKSPKTKMYHDNWDLVVRNALNRLNFYYGINLFGGLEELSLNTQDNLDTETQQDESTELETVAEDEMYRRSGDNTKSTEQTLSKKLRELFSQIPVTDKDMKIVKDPVFNQGLGMDPSVMHAVLNENLTGRLLYPEQLIPMLKKMVPNNPWVDELIIWLEEDETGQLFNAVYSQYRMHNQDMGILVTDRKNKGMKFIPKNRSLAKDKLEKTTSTIINSGIILTDYIEKSLYNAGGRPNAQSTYDRTKIANEVFKPVRVSTFKRIMTDPVFEKKELNGLTFNQWARERLAEVGIQTPEDIDIKNAIIQASQGSTLDDAWRTYKDKFMVPIKQMWYDLNKFKGKDVNVYELYKSKYREVFDILQYTITDVSETSAKIGKKNRYSVVKPNYINTLVDRIRQFETNYKVKEWVENSFSSIDFFRDQDTGEWRSEWAKLLFSEMHPDDISSEVGVPRYARKTLEYMRLIASDENEYSDWDEETCSLALYNMYLNGGIVEDDTKLTSAIDTAFYRVGIYSDSPAGDFLKFYRYRTGKLQVGYADEVTYEQILLHKNYGLFKQEMSRIRTVKQRALNKMNGEEIYPISGFDATFSKKDKNTLATAGGLVLRYLPQLNYVKIDDDFINYFTKNINSINNIALKDTFQKAFDYSVSSSLSNFAQVLPDITGISFLDAMNYLYENADRYGLTEDDIECFFSVAYKKTFDEDFDNIYKDWVESGKINDSRFKGTAKNAVHPSKQELIKAINKYGNSLLFTDQERDFLKYANKFVDDFNIRKAIDIFNKYLPQEEQITFKYSENYEHLREYEMNAQFAKSQIFQLTTTDLAFYGKVNVVEDTQENSNFSFTYKDSKGKEHTKYYRITKDSTIKTLQKRFKEVHAPSTKFNNSVGEYARSYERTVVLSDNEIQSRVLNEITNIVNNNPNLKDGEKKIILDAFKNINTADAQAYRTLSSYERLIGQMGLMTPQIKYAIENIKNGKFNLADFNVVFQTLKPYVFTRKNVDSGVTTKDGNPIFISNPIQHKNSEFALMVMFSAVAHSSKSIVDSPVLAGINEYMEKNDIDVIQFNSAQKVGNQGVINSNMVQQNTKDAVVKALENITGITPENPQGNPNIIHELSTDDWGIQMATPQHIIDKSQAIGAQIKTVMLLDIPDDATFTLPGSDKTFTKTEFINHYNNLLSADIIEAFSELNSKFKDPKKIEALLQETVATSFKYSQNLVDAFTWDEKTQSFKIPLHDRIIADQVEQIINSAFRNAISKQYTRGGTCIQVSDFGVKDELNIRYKDKNGELLDTKKEFVDKINKVRKKSNKPEVTEDEADTMFNKYVDDNMHSIAYIECYMPCFSEELYYAICDENGFMDINKLPEELRKVIAYRSPTEDTYSCLPLKIVGFTPPFNGSVIMLPADITTITGSDFDVDKLFLMLKEFNIEKYNINKAKADYKKAQDAFDVEFDQWFNWHCDDVDENGKSKYELPKEQYKISTVDYHYDKKQHENSKDARHNSLIDTYFEILTSPTGSRKILNPGGFSEAKHEAKLNFVLESLSPAEMMSRTKTDNITDAIHAFENMSVDELEDIEDFINRKRNPLSDFTAVKLHSQNMQGASQISIYAIYKAFSPLAQHANGSFVFNSSEAPFILNGNKSVKPETILFTTKNGEEKALTRLSIGRSVNENGRLISKAIANFVAMSVDNGKDPNLALLNSTMDSANIYCTLTLMGYEIKEIAALMTTPVVKEIFKHKINSPIDFSKRIKTIRENIVHKYGNQINKSKLSEMLSKTKDLTTEQLYAAKIIYQKMQRDQSVSKDDLTMYFAITENVLNSIETMYDISNQLNYAVQTARGDSSAGSAGPYMINNINLERKTDCIHDKEITPNIEFEKPILPNDATITDYGNLDNNKLRERYYDKPTGFKQAMTELGVFSIKNLVGEQFIEYNPKIRSLLERLANKQVNINEKRAKKLLNAIQMYAASYSPSFGIDEQINSYIGKRAWYLIKFPQQFKEWKDSLDAKYVQGNSFLNNLVFNERTETDPFSSITLQNVGNSKNIKDTISNDWGQLYYDNPDMATKLFVYSVFRGGFGPNPMSFTAFAPMLLLEKTPGYLNAIRDFINNMNDDSIENFWQQFCRNNYDDNTICPIIENTIQKISFKSDALMKVESKIINEDRLNKEGINYFIKLLPSVVKDVSSKGVQLYRLDENSLVECVNNYGDRYYKAEYVPVEKLGLGYLYPEYSPEEDIESLLVNRPDDFNSQTDNDELADFDNSENVNDNELDDANNKKESNVNKKPTLNETKRNTDSLGNILC